MGKLETLTTLSTQDTGRRKTKQINIRENRRGNQEWTIQRNWKHWIHKTQDEDKQNKKAQHRKLKRSLTRTHRKKMKYKKKNGGKPRYP